MYYTKKKILIQRKNFTVQRLVTGFGSVRFDHMKRVIEALLPSNITFNIISIIIFWLVALIISVGYHFVRLIWR